MLKPETTWHFSRISKISARMLQKTQGGIDRAGARELDKCQMPSHSGQERAWVPYWANRPGHDGEVVSDFNHMWDLVRYVVWKTILSSGASQFFPLLREKLYGVLLYIMLAVTPQSSPANLIGLNFMPRNWTVLTMSTISTLVKITMILSKGYAIIS